MTPVSCSCFDSSVRSLRFPHFVSSVSSQSPRSDAVTGLKLPADDVERIMGGTCSVSEVLVFLKISERSEYYEEKCYICSKARLLWPWATSMYTFLVPCNEIIQTWADMRIIG